MKTAGIAEGAKSRVAARNDVAGRRAPRPVGVQNLGDCLDLALGHEEAPGQSFRTLSRDNREEELHLVRSLLA